MSRKISITASLCFMTGICLAWVSGSIPQENAKDLVPLSDGAAFQTSSQKMKFDNDNFDFGKISEGDIVEHEFKFTNVDKDTLRISDVKASCGCTAALLSANTIAPGGTGEIKATFNSRGKSGLIKKSIQIRMKGGAGSAQIINFTADVELKAGAKNHPGDMTGSYFRGKCVNCHVEPGVGKFGKELFAASCSMCHGPDGHGHVALAINNPDYLKKVDDRYLEERISDGSPKNKMMLGFSSAHSGPLDHEQIRSLVAYIRSWEKN